MRTRRAAGSADDLSPRDCLRCGEGTVRARLPAERTAAVGGLPRCDACADAGAFS